MEPILDHDHFNAQIAGDIALGREVLGLFRHQVEMWERLLDPSMDTQAWKDAAHSLKGSARAIGATALAVRCQEAEDAADGALAARSVALAELRSVIALTLEAAAVLDHRLSMLSLRRSSQATSS